MNGVAQHDEEGVGRRVQYERGAGEAGVARRARGGHRAHVPVLVELEAEPVVVAGKGGVEVGEHQVHRLRPQDARGAVDAAVEQRAAEDREVPGTREHPRVARDPAKAEGVLVVHLAPHEAAVQPRPGRAGVLRGGDLRLPGRGRVVAGAGEAERGRDPLAQKVVEGAAGDLLQDQLEGDQVEVRVEVGRTGRVERRLVPDETELRLVRRCGVEGDPVTESRGVGEELTDRDPLLAGPAEVREVRGDGRLQLQRAALRLLHGEQ